jgi:hypothetical protein
MPAVFAVAPWRRLASRSRSPTPPRRPSASRARWRGRRSPAASTPDRTPGALHRSPRRRSMSDSTRSPLLRSTTATRVSHRRCPHSRSTPSRRPRPSTRPPARAGLAPCAHTFSARGRTARRRRRRLQRPQRLQRRERLDPPGRGRHPCRRDRPQLRRRRRPPGQPGRDAGALHQGGQVQPPVLPARGQERPSRIDGRRDLQGQGLPAVALHRRARVRNPPLITTR